MGTKTYMLTLLMCLAVLVAGQAGGQVSVLDKKLIEYGWDVPTPDFIRAHIADMENRPFDGLIFKLRGGMNALEPKAWDAAAFAQDYEDLANIPWKTFTDNFVIILAASNQDWFNDGQWQAILHNVALIAKAGRIGRCAGVCFDPEPYGANPWVYGETAHKDSKTFPEYEAQVRQRGGQFVRALQTELPSPTILTFFQLSLFSGLCVPKDPAAREAELAKGSYGLLPAFLEGMLDEAAPGTVIVDGNENAYYYTERAPYFDVYHLVAQRGLYLVEPSLRPAYRDHVRMGQALYVDQYFGLRAEKVLGHFMKPEERTKWFEHNVYWALSTADRYVWCYSERMNWWTNTDVPPGSEDAIRSARTKYATGAALGFDLAPIVQEAQQRQKAEAPK